MRLALLVAGALLAACGGPAAESPTPGSDGEADLVALEAAARDLVDAAGCGDGQCATAPVGSRPCGGPRDYVVYCPLTTDTIALFAGLQELEQAEEEHNARTGAISTCEMRLPPAVAVRGGMCVAVPGAPAQPQ